MGTNSYIEATLGLSSTVKQTPSAPLANRDMGFVDRSKSDTIENPGEKYVTDYYAGSQIAIFMGDIWLSDVTMIQYSATQQKKPFWGYKSKKFDLVAQGTQLIEGAFAINYTHTNFLNMAVARWRETSEPRGSSLQISEEDVADFAKTLQQSSDPRLLTNLEISPSSELYTKDFDSLPDTSKQAMLESYFWGADTKVQSNAVLQADDLPPFDIVITFGNYPKSRLNPNATDEFVSAHTVKAITGIHITGSSMQLSITGEPVQEVFTFIARSLDSPLTRVPKSL